MEELLIAFMSKTLNMDNESVAELLYKKSDDGKITKELNPDALNGFLAKDAERIAKVKPAGKSKDAKETDFDNGYKAAEKKISEKWEKQLREEFGITDAEAKGDKLITLAKTTAAEAKPLENDKVKVHPLYLALEKKAAEDLAAKETEFNNTLTEREAAAKRNERVRTNKGKGREILKGLNPVLPKNQTVADNQINDFVKKLEAYDYEGEGDDPIVMKDGKRLEDQHGHPVRLSSLVKEQAAGYFEFAVQTEKGNAGNGGDGGKTTEAASTGVRVPKDEAEYNDMYLSAGSMEERDSIKAVWEAKGGE